RIGIAVRPELRVQRTEAYRNFGVLDRLVLEDRDAVLVAGEVLVADRGLYFFEVERRGDALKLARPDDPFAVRRHVYPVGRFAAGHEVDEAGYLLRIDHPDAANHLPLAFGGGLLGGAPVDRGDVVTVALRRRDLELPGRPLGVVGREEHPPVRYLLAGIAEV